MDILPIILFLLGFGFLFLGWRWQNPPNEEALTALKGLAYLKREIIQIQDKVLDLESKLLESKEIDFQKVEHRVSELVQLKLNIETSVGGATPTEAEYGVPFPLVEEEVSRLNEQKSKQFNPSPKYQEVLELAANGQRIPEIAQRLFLSQDEVRMVLRMQSKGETL